MLSLYEKETYFCIASQYESLCFSTTDLISNEAEKEAVISTYNSSLIRKLKNAMEEHAEINLVKDNPDGSCEFIIPKNVTVLANKVR